MGIFKEAQLKDESILTGNEAIPAVNGAYLYVYKGDKLLGIVSIPSPNLMADNYRESMVINDDILVDENGKEYEIEVISSNYGIDWEFLRYPDDDIDDIRVEVKYNEY